MTRTYLAASIALGSLVAIGINCSSDPPPFMPPATGSGGASGSSAGTGGSGGSTAGTGGSVSGTGGGSGGSVMPDAGGSGGMASGTGGMSGGSGGMGGGGGAVAMSPCTATGDCTAVLKMDGAFNLDPPASRQGSDGIQGPSGIDGVPGPVCVVTENNATHGTPFKEYHWQMMGPGITMGAPYKVTVHITGVLECKTYQNITKCPRAANAGRGATYDLWCPEGTDPPLTVPGDHYNTVMLSVTPTKSTSTPNIGPMNGPLPAVGNWWMLNECPSGVNEGHLTWKVDMEKTITVPGGSWINFVEFDTNCREIINCGPSTDSGVTCMEQFSIQPPATAVPAPPASIKTQPAAPGGGAFGNWIYFDVVGIVP